MLGNYPEESIQHSEHSKSLKSRIYLYYFMWNLYLVKKLSWIHLISFNQKCEVEISNIYINRNNGIMEFHDNFSFGTLILPHDDLSRNMFHWSHIQGVPAGMCQTSGGRSLC